MDINNVTVFDTSGDLASDIFKNDVDKSALSAWIEENKGIKVLNLSANNIRFASVPDVNNLTYLTFLTYNGYAGTMNNIYAAVVATDKGKFDTHNVPVLQYSATTGSNLNVDDNTIFKDIMLDIKMYNGSIDVLNYADTRMSHGPLSKYSKDYIVTSRRSFPTHITSLPNSDKSKTFFDGWYSYTQILFRNLDTNERVYKGGFYAVDGFIFKASDDGTFINEYGEKYIRTLDGEVIIQEENTNYEEILFSLNEATGISPLSNNIYLHSQVLILEEIREAIINEVVDVACSGDVDCALMDWQRLTLNRIAAYIMFENGLFDKAQKIIESSRTMCCNNGMNSLNSNC